MKLTDFSLLALQTAYMQRDLTTQGMCAALQPELLEVAQSTYNILVFQALDTLGDTPLAHELVDELAWQFHCDFYDKSADIKTKANLVKQSIRIHRMKGTKQAVVDLLAVYYPYNTELLEWFEYGGEPYHFKIRTSHLNAADKDKFMRALNSVKNARSYLDEIEYLETLECAAISQIFVNRDITYKMNVGNFLDYTFKNGEVLTFGSAEKAYSFIEQ